MGPIHFADERVVNPSNAFDSRLRGDQVPLGSSSAKSQKRSFITFKSRCNGRTAFHSWLKLACGF